MTVQYLCVLLGCFLVLYVVFIFVLCMLDLPVVELFFVCFNLVFHGFYAQFLDELTLKELKDLILLVLLL